MVIELEAVTYSYPGLDDKATALKDVYLTLYPGCFALVVGRSGSGKSTLLKCLNGLVPNFYGGRFSGVVRVFGRDAVTLGPRRMAEVVGYVFQDPEAQFVVDRVEDEISFGLENLGFDARTRRKRIEDVLDALGIVQLRHRKLTELSGGERQKVALASALALYPHVLVLDEPTSQLDPWSAEELFMVVHRLNTDFGITVLMAEHRLERVLGHADVMVTVAGGRVRTGKVEQMVAELEIKPPLVELALRLKLNRMPLTVKEAKQLVAPLGKVSSPSYETRGTPGEPLLRLRSIRFSYGRISALNGIDLEINAGEVLAVMGRNGSGKTTLLRAMAGLVKPDGTIERGNGFEAGYLPQDPNALLLSDTVLDELTLGLRSRNLPVSGLDAVIDTLALGGILHRHPRDLSAGQRELVACAAVAASYPDLLLLDEPTRGLDYAEKGRLSKFLREYVRAGRAVVLASHDVETVARVADRVALMSEGEVVVEGPTREVLAGSLNFSTQVNRVFGDAFITVEDVLEAMSHAEKPRGPGI